MKRFASFEAEFEQAYQDALQAAKKIEDAWDRSEALSAIAEALGEAGQFDRAVFDHAVKVAETIDDPILRLQAFATIVAAKKGKSKGDSKTGTIPPPCSSNR